MLGQLGEAEIAAVGVAARATFVTTIMLLGVTTGGALLTAQYWGAGNKVGVRQSTSLTWMISMVFAAPYGGVIRSVPRTNHAPDNGFGRGDSTWC